MAISNTVVRHLSCFPLGTRPARNAVSVRNCTTITVAFTYVSSWVLMVLLLQLLSLSLDPSFPNQALRRELCIVSCQVLNLPPRPSVRPSLPDENGCLSAIFQLQTRSFLPSFPAFVLLPPPSTAHFCDGNLSLDTQKVTQTKPVDTLGDPSLIS